MSKSNCNWHRTSPILSEYHNSQWGRPCKNDTELFQKISLETLQAGLSWHTILKKKKAICKSFAHFNPDKIVLFGEKDIKSLLSNPNIIRNRKKIEAIIHNAKIMISIQKRYGSFSQFVWKFRPKDQRKPHYQIPDEAKKLTLCLKKHQWQFIGPTTTYAFMQAAGIINDHDLTCPIREMIIKNHPH